MAPSSRSRTFELDLTRYQLRMDGRPLHLERQAMELLILLARRRDQLVVRDDIAAELWPAGVHIDIDQSINRLIRKVRLALRDDPDAPRFIETVVGKGYRFVGPLSVVNGGPAAAPDDEHMTSAVPAVEGPPARLEHVTAPQATTTASTGVASPRVYRVWVLAGVVLIAAAVLAAVIRSRPSSPPSLTPLTALVGDERFPALSPDGTQVAFEWSGETRENANIWVQQVGAGVPAIPLTTDPATETMPAWSPDGTRIAYQRQKGDRFSLHVVSASGGSSRQFSEWLVTGMMSPASWTPDAASVVTADVANGKPRILVIPVAGGEAREMFSSLAARLFRDPAVAPDESALAFHWCKDTLDVCDVYLLALAPGYVARGTPTPLTHDGHQAAGLVWSRDAQSVIYADGLRRGLMRISRSGASERLELAGIGAFHPSLSKSGDRLAFTRVGWDMHLWRFGRDTSEPEPLLRSTQVDIAPDLSADGSQVVFGSERAGLGRQIWIADADAGHPRALTEPTKRAQGRPRWSPNSKAIVYSSELDDGRRRAMIVDVATGKTRPLQSGFAEEQMPSWSADGGWIIFSTAVNGRLEIWRAPSEGSGPAQQLTKAGGFVGIESPSGQLFYTKGRASPIFMRLPDGGERQVVPSVSQWSFAPTERHLYYIAREEGGSRTVFVLRRLDLATGGTTTLNRFSARRQRAHGLSRRQDDHYVGGEDVGGRRPSNH